MNNFRPGDDSLKQYSGEEQLELMRRAQSGDMVARNDLITSYMPAVVCEVRKRCRRKRHEFDDCAQEVIARLMRAVECFEPARGIAVSTYFFRTMHSTIVSFNRGRPLRGKYCAFVSLDATEDPDLLAIEDEPYAEMLCAEQRGEKQRSVAAVLHHATARQRDVLLRYFAGESLQELGNSLGVTRERIRQIKAKGIDRIREAEALPQGPDGYASP